MAFIASAAGTGIFGLLSYALQPVIPWLATACLVIAVLVGFVFLSASLTIVKFWIDIAKTGAPPRS